MIRSAQNFLRRFRKDASGAAILEFTIGLPLLLLVLAIIIEGSRITWIHQAAASGVRDASRYLARTQSAEICSGANFATQRATFNARADIDTRATNIVTRNVDFSESILPNRVSVVDVDFELQCTTVTYSNTNSARVPVIEVEVTLTIDFPFGGVFAFFGEPLQPLTTTISDETRMFGV